MGEGEKWTEIMNNAAAFAGLKAAVSTINHGSLGITLWDKNTDKKGKGVQYNMYEKDGKHQLNGFPPFSTHFANILHAFNPTNATHDDMLAFSKAIAPALNNALVVVPPAPTVLAEA